MRTTPPAEARREAGAGAAVEVRSTGRPVEVRADGDDDLGITGYGSLYNVRATIGFFFQFDEEVAPGAWDATIDGGDQRCMFNHDANWLLGRTTAGSLRLSSDDTGLLYDCDINPDDTNARSVHAKVARGDVSGSSVFFRVIREEWTEPTDDNGLERPVRRILEAELFETGPVVFPAFEDTTVGARCMDALDSVLRTAGVTGTDQRSRLITDLVADPSALTVQLRSLFDRRPDVRDAVCACGTRAGSPPAPDPNRELLQRRARGIAALHGLPFA
jgi:HK97 family phage prohead protease